jgi:hypothetical protein
MRRMLLTREEFRWIEHQLFERKLKEYEKVLAEMKEERKSARRLSAMRKVKDFQAESLIFSTSFRKSLSFFRYSSSLAP